MVLWAGARGPRAAARARPASARPQTCPSRSRTGPAMPQQPESSSSTSAPVACSSASSSFMLIKRLLVAMAVHDDVAPGHLRRLQYPGDVGEHFARAETSALPSRCARSSLGKKLISSSRKTLAQLGSSTTTGIPASICGPSSIENAEQVCARLDRGSRSRRAGGRSRYASAGT